MNDLLSLLSSRLVFWAIVFALLSAGSPDTWDAINATIAGVEPAEWLRLRGE